MYNRSKNTIYNLVPIVLGINNSLAEANQHGWYPVEAPCMALCSNAG